MRGWTKREKEILLEFHGKITHAELLKKLPDRSMGSIRYQVTQLGIGKKNLWTKEELNFLESARKYQIPTKVIAQAGQS